MNDNTLPSKCILGDCLEKMNDIPDNSINLILTDIPYQTSRKNNFKTMKDRTGRNGIDFGEWDIVFDISTLKKLTSKLVDGGAFIICHSFEQYDEVRKNLTESLLLKDKLIFRKTNPMPRNRERRYIQNIEMMSWYIKDGKWIFNRQKEPYEDSVMSFPAESGGGFIKYHPTQKPVKLFEYLVKIHTNENDIVLDPFAGSGTTAIACLNTNRNYICIEKEPKYFEIMQKRIAERQPQTTLPYIMSESQ